MSHRHSRGVAALASIDVIRDSELSVLEAEGLEAFVGTVTEEDVVVAQDQKPGGVGVPDLQEFLRVVLLDDLRTGQPRVSDTCLMCVCSLRKFFRKSTLILRIKQLRAT